uniref:Neurotransmitter-gated ion-channel ligand-binding domain-containing protein n=1 Tax=Romanomermis culicivorax TaxID=13658 RepID=A0A915JEA8_ROMCU
MLLIQISKNSRSLSLASKINNANNSSSITKLPTEAKKKCSGHNNNTLEKYVLDEIMKNYDPKVVPSPKGVDVEVDVIIQAITGVSEMTASFTTDLLFSQIWSDPGLKYGHITDCIENITLGHRMIDRIWVPNVCFVN